MTDGRANDSPFAWTRTDTYLVAALLALALVLRLVFFRGLYAFDDYNYLRHAAEIWKLRFELEQVLYWHGMRVLLFGPIGLSFALFGVSEAAAVLWPLAASLGSLVLVFALTARLAGRSAGALAAAALAMLPMAVDGSTKVLPGVFIGLLTAAIAYAYVRSETAPTGRGRWLALSGVLYAAMPWAGHLGLVSGIFFPVALVTYRRHRLASYWPLVAGAAVVVGVAVFLQLVVADDPVANLSVSRTVLETETPTPKPLFYLKLMVRPLEAHGGVFLLSALGGLAALAGLPRALAGRDGSSSARAARGALLALLWFLGTYALIEFASTSLTEYRPMFKQTRYLTALAIPGVVLAGIGGAWLYGVLARTAGRRIATPVVSALFLAAALGSVATLRAHDAPIAARRAPIATVARHVRAFEGRTIYVTHWLWNTRVGFFLGYQDAYFPSGYAPYRSLLLEQADTTSMNRYVQTLAPGEPLAGGLLINDERLLRSSIGPTETRMVREGEIPVWLAEPPAAWRLVDRVEGVALYEIPEGYVWPGGD